MSQLSMILEGNGGMSKSKKENIYLVVFLMFSEFIALKRKKGTLQIFDSEEGKCIEFWFILFLFICVSLTMNELYHLDR